MNVLKILTFVSFLIPNFIFNILPLQAINVCKVTDPTGTPLNIRTSPNGQIIGKLSNQKEVYIEEIISDNKGKPWAKVGGYGVDGKYRIYGWVFREFISCYERYDH
jgi:hypothetical protein